MVDTWRIPTATSAAVPRTRVFMVRILFMERAVQLINKELLRKEIIIRSINATSGASDTPLNHRT